MRSRWSDRDADQPVARELACVMGTLRNWVSRIGAEYTDRMVSLRERRKNEYSEAL